MRESKDMYKGIVRTDRRMTHLEVDNAAANIEAIESRLEDRRTGVTNTVEWLCLAPGLIIILIAILMNL